jgi:hypothetical protein
MKPWIKFGLINATMGLLIGILLNAIALADNNDFLGFLLVAPLAAFLVAGYFWKWIIKDAFADARGKIVLVGFLSGTVSHLLTWYVLSLTFWQGCYLNASCGSPYELKEIILGGIFLSFYSILLFGWLTIGSSIAIGFYIKRSELKKLATPAG